VTARGRCSGRLRAKKRAAPPWPEAVAAFTAFLAARDKQDAQAMGASLARLQTVITAAEQHEPASGLSLKHERFVEEYLVDLNATAAYRRVYGAGVKDADASGPRLLGNVGIAAAIAAGKARQAVESTLSATRTLEELRRIAFANIRDYWRADGSVKHPNELTAEQGAALAGFEVLIKNAKAGDGITDTIHKFKLWDKVRSLETLAKHFGLITEKIELKSEEAEARVARLVAARKRLEKPPAT
jgi:phage terminase small subunit